MACVATWAFGIDAVKVASGLLDNGTDCVEAIEKAINCVEDDPTTGVYYVGRGCYPNKEGVVQLDAAIMRGTDHAIGSVCSIERYPRPITIARHIMEHSPHNIMVGDGATQYALNNGFILESNSSLLIDEGMTVLLRISIVLWWKINDWG
jgi:N4-(beta-N-acetylglucosaminyl)-L-asparaginase